MSKTTIPLEEKTRDRLKRFGMKGETYDDICRRLLTYAEELNLEELIEERWMRLQREKEDYVSLEDV